MAGTTEILVSGGVAAVLAAVAGGGLKAFGVELPLLATIRRQVLVMIVGVGLIALGLMSENPLRGDRGAGEDALSAQADKAAPLEADIVGVQTPDANAAIPQAPTPETAPPAVSAARSDRPEVPNIVDLPFPVARQFLLQNGWAPINLGSPMANSNLGLRGQEIFDSGFGETAACSGTGMGFCVFRYRNPRGHVLEVVAAGEDVQTARVNGANILDCSAAPKPDGC